MLVSDIVSLRERGTWQGVINIISGTGTGVDAGEYLGRQQSGGAGTFISDYQVSLSNVPTSLGPS